MYDERRNEFQGVASGSGAVHRCKGGLRGAKTVTFGGLTVPSNKNDIIDWTWMYMHTPRVSGK